eukprot:TRINITY_DN12102_c0_g1_i2.p2 TRINITY_DN12102_c0_g1~~TRINITY_DN12102_c0_g1_i2.p2  ORF type:complete len:103 (-),score=0.27 TRINITY_DN12102_c0_g1_i2:766-1074(-)
MDPLLSFCNQNHQRLNEKYRAGTAAKDSKNRMFSFAILFHPSKHNSCSQEEDCNCTLTDVVSAILGVLFIVFHPEDEEVQKDAGKYCKQYFPYGTSLSEYFT